MASYKNTKQKIINDPLYGFITISSPLLFDLIEHPIFQRLRHISQTGLSYLVYPGAHHTRFHHSLGCMYLMQKALNTLKQKGVEISQEEEEGACIAILLHDIGHGPFSHALEHSIIEVHHEEISLYLFNQLNKEFNGALDLAIQIFKGEYHRGFFKQLISSQLDVDRLDYLMRDSFYTGVAEGTISIDRLISMMNVVDDEIVIEAKGIYSVEKFIIARMFMYWQVYLHKTGVGAEYLLTKILKRAHELYHNNFEIWTTPELEFFFKRKIKFDDLNEEVMKHFLMLSDADIWICIKQWSKSKDEILAKISKMLLNRNLYKVEETEKEQLKDYFLEELNLSPEIIKNEYFSGIIPVKNLAYDKENPIKLLMKNGRIIRLEEVSKQLDFKVLSKPVKKHYFCYLKRNHNKF
ncbi:deoxynucleoside triphosphate triphosphohydrolase SAMHD1 [Flavobacteriaceae bacterium UJ101]|nr:deoxynucleoside triphosphate triphosphohydrolase SAMHD1 [Flavobacteriaceae bacterium UJ101]